MIGRDHAEHWALGGWCWAIVPCGGELSFDDCTYLADVREGIVGEPSWFRDPTVLDAQDTHKPLA